MTFNNQDLDRIYSIAQERGFISVDTEFVWRKTYAPELGLIQFGFSPEETFLIDTTLPVDKEILKEMMANQQIVKILHDAKQDLMIISNYIQGEAKSVFDTHLAAGFCGMLSTLSLQNILKENLGVELPKSETCTDWLQRPLSEGQTEYARDDVRFLNQLRLLFLEKAQQLQTYPYLNEEMSLFNDPHFYQEKTPEERWRKIKGCGRLLPKEKSLLRELSSVREAYAKQINIPRTWVLNDECLCKLAQAFCTTEEALFENHLTTKQIKSLGKAIIQATQIVNQQTPNMYPQTISLPISEKQKKIVRATTDWLKLRGEELHIDPALFGNRHDITLLVFNICQNQLKADQHNLLIGWRAKVIGEETVKFIQNQYHKEN